MNAKTLKRRCWTATMFFKRFFFVLMVIYACLTAAPLFSAETDKAGIAERTIEKSVENIADKAVEKALLKAATAIVAEDAAKGRRPDESKGPTTVHFLVFILDINNINAAAQNFTANVFLRLRWKDTRLANPEGEIRQIPIDEIWNPQALFSNQMGPISRSLPDVAQVHPDGTVLYFQRYTGTFSQRLMLADFPMDKHNFTIEVVGTGHNPNDLTFVPDHVNNIRGGSMANTLSLTDWEILAYKTVVAPYKPIEEVNTAAFAFHFQAKRFVSYYLWQVVLPLAVVVIMSWAAFWIGREHLGVRIAVATSSILTLIAHRFILASLLPKLPYMTHLDYFTVGSTFLVLLALITVIAASVLTANNQENQARKVDLLARGGFPAAFLLLLGWFLAG
jgi:Neurotransmitter-gated ion-channel ligand binding domain